MPCLKIKNGFLSVGGKVFKIKVGEQIFEFEDHSYCGPMPIKKVGPMHYFWTAVTLWCQQGKKINSEGLCEYEI